MSEHNLRYYGLIALSGLTAVGWLLNKITPEITSGVFIAITTVVVLDLYKHRDDKGE